MITYFFFLPAKNARMQSKLIHTIRTYLKNNNINVQNKTHSLDDATKIANGNENKRIRNYHFVKTRHNAKHH